MTADLHLSDEHLQGLLRGLPDDEASACVQHLEACAVCKRRLDDLAAKGQTPAEVKLGARQLLSETPAEETECVAARERLLKSLALRVKYSGPWNVPFGRFIILRLLGEGAQATVFLARDSNPLLSREVALKIMKPASLARPEARKRFQRETEAVARLDGYPNVAQVYEVGTEQDETYVVMPFYRGLTLRHLLDRRGHLPVADAVALIRTLAVAMDSVHSLGLYHRDLKLSNVLLNERDEPFITDFGLVSAHRVNDERITQLGQILGTAGYMAPEQVQTTEELRSPGIDVYALGAILYRLLAHRPVFEGRREDVLRATLNTVPLPPSKSHPDVDDKLDQICLKMLAKKPEQRHRSMEEVVKALDAWASAQRRPKKTRRGWLRAVGVVLGLVVFGVLGRVSVNVDLNALFPALWAWLSPAPVVAVSSPAGPPAVLDPTGEPTRDKEVAQVAGKALHDGWVVALVRPSQKPKEPWYPQRGPVPVKTGQRFSIPCRFNERETDFAVCVALLGSEEAAQKLIEEKQVLDVKTQQLALSEALSVKFPSVPSP